MRRRRLLKRGGTMLKQSDVEAALTNYRAAQPLRRRRAKARRAPHAATRPVIGMASPRPNRPVDTASNTVAVTATPKARLCFIAGLL
jgi:hypothetical protein